MTNTDPTGVHTFTSGTVDGFSPSPDGAFDSGVLMPGDSFQWRIMQEGEQPYYCMLHPWMVGTIVVEEYPYIDPDTMNDVLVIIGSIGNYNPDQSHDLKLTIIDSTGKIPIPEQLGNFPIPTENGTFINKILLRGPALDNGIYTLVLSLNGAQSTTVFNYYSGIGEIEKTLFIENYLFIDPTPEPVVDVDTTPPTLTQD